MPYLEVGRYVPGSYHFNGPFTEGEVITGCIGGKESYVEILGDESLTLNNVVCEREKGAIVFDQDRGLFKSQRVLVYIDEARASEIKRLKADAEIPLYGARLNGVLADILAKLYKRGYQQTNIDFPKENVTSTIKRLPQYIIAFLGV